MKLQEKKNKIYEWEDFFGGDIIDRKMVEEANNDKELDAALARHSAFLEDQLLGALSHLSEFRKSLQLDY